MVVGSPMPFHVAQCVAALERGVHVLCEVTAGVSIEECKELVLAASRSDAIYMMAENLNYDRTTVLISSLVETGQLGQCYYAEGEYLHDVKALAVSTPWRRHWQMGIRGLTYCTHALGPIMRWFRGDRIVRVCCEDSGSHYLDAEGKGFAGDAAVMLCKTAQGRLIKIRVDLTSNRPYGLNFELQGTNGVIEVRNGQGDDWGSGRIALGDGDAWRDLSTTLANDEFDEFLPAQYQSGSVEAQTALRSGHGGSDYYTTATFIEACQQHERGGAVSGEVVGIHEACDMTLPGLCSQLSAARGGAWVDVPDSRDWVASTAKL